MRSTITLIFIIVSLFDKIWFTITTQESSFEFDLYTDIKLMQHAFVDAFSSVGNSIISMGRILSYGWLHSGNYLFNFSFALNYQDAEYFFYKEQRPRDRKYDLMKKGLKRKMTYFQKEFANGDAGRKYEYYCEDTDPHKLINYCLWALKNKRMSKKISWTFDETVEPHCEFKFVHLKRHNYKTWRTFLKCPISIKQKNESERRSNIYISSVENAPSNRLIFYLFMLSPNVGAEESGESSQSQSIEYEPPRKSTGSVNDFDERDRVSIRDFQPSRKSLGSIHEIEEIETTTVSSSTRHIEMGEKESASVSSKGKHVINADEPAEKNEYETTKSAQAPVRKLSVRDFGPPRAHTSRPHQADIKMKRAVKSSIDEFQLPRSDTRKKADFQSRPTSLLPSRNYIYDSRGRLKRVVSEEKPKEPEPMPLEIVTLLINKRHTLASRPKG